MFFALCTRLGFFFGLTSLLVTSAVIAGNSVSSANLADYRWQKRLLLIFAPNSAHPALQAMQRELERAAKGVADRDLVVFTILAEGQSFRNGQAVAAAEATALRQRFGIAPEAAVVVLIGKDGGVKLQRPAPVPLTDIFALIDSMPMRQRERRGQ